jgi:hypothetical protein
VPVVRFIPGEPAPRAGSYELVLQWGERTGIAAQLQHGQPLPAVSVQSGDELWWVECEPMSEPAPPQRSTRSHGAPRRAVLQRPRTAGAAPPVRITHAPRLQT